MRTPVPEDLVEQYFDVEADYWARVYSEPSVSGLIYRERQQAALAWVDSLGIQLPAPALDIGCGAGFMTVALARRGFSVTASDTSGEMVRTARELVAEAALPEGQVEVVQARAESLPLPSEAYALVVALGVVPWLEDVGRSAHEMARVLQPGGWLVLTADNAARLNALTEPRENPGLSPLRALVRASRGERRVTPGTSAPSRRHTPGQIERLLRDHGLVAELRTTVGYGPFTFLGRPLLGEPKGTRLHLRLQQAAARHPALRRHGWHYIVAAQKRS